MLSILSNPKQHKQNCFCSFHYEIFLYFSVGPDFLSTVYICHLKNDDNESDWTMMYEYYKSAVSPQEQTRALVAISSTSNIDRLKR